MKRPHEHDPSEQCHKRSPDQPTRARVIRFLRRRIRRTNNAVRIARRQNVMLQSMLQHKMQQDLLADEERLQRLREQEQSEQQQEEDNGSVRSESESDRSSQHSSTSCTDTEPETEAEASDEKQNGTARTGGGT